MPIVRTKPSEFLVVAERGRLANRGAAASLFLRRRTAWVKVPGDQQEARFEMTQETRDGIPLRFKGSAVLRIVRPEAAAQLFDFSGEEGLAAMKTLACNACLAELRDQVSHMTMQECIEQRKTTLTGAVQAALEALVGAGEGGWGVTLDSVQVAQVFIVDQDLRRQLEAETRGRIRSASDLAELSARESVELAKLAAARRVQQESLESEKQQIALDREKRTLQAETERQQIALDREKRELEAESERAAIETDKPVQLARFRNRLEVLRAEKEALELERQVEEIAAAKDLIRTRAEHELRRDILPLEQAPQIVESASRLFQGARLSVYGGDGGLMDAVAPLLDVLADGLRTTLGGAPGQRPHGRPREGLTPRALPDHATRGHRSLRPQRFFATVGPYHMFSPLDLLALIGLVLGTLAAAAFLAFAVVRWRLTRRIAAALGPGKIMLTAPARVEPLGGRPGATPGRGGSAPSPWAARAPRGRPVLPFLDRRPGAVRRRSLDHLHRRARPRRPRPRSTSRADHAALPERGGEGGRHRDPGAVRRAVGRDDPDPSHRPQGLTPCREASSASS